MNRIIVAVAACLAIAASVARGQTPPPRTTFVTVDAVRTEQTYTYETNQLLITGVLAGATSATEERLRFTTGVDVAECKRWALLVMAKPGQYQLSFSGRYTATTTPPYWTVYDCQLSRAAP